MKTNDPTRAKLDPILERSRQYGRDLRRKQLWGCVAVAVFVLVVLAFIL